ncbi:MAG: N-formylglutamate deformylase [Robiginitomaculum sp.]|nr:MAG: N-formylglutamate deformylase [Robiginitomaculum sp.]
MTLQSVLFICEEHDGPVLLNFPHSGVELPDEIASQLNERGHVLADTDWHVPELYSFARGQVSWLEAKYARYVVDLNRDPDGTSLYPGQASTGFCPDTDFVGAPIYQIGQSPDVAEIKVRRTRYFDPYHTMLQSQIERIRAKFGFCILLDCHSIRSEVPRLFLGQLPDLNLGVFGGNSCASELADLAQASLQGGPFSFVRDGRFKGGWITRNYGQPKRGVHALQLEITQSCYMDEQALGPFVPDRAKELQKVLGKLVKGMSDYEAG